MSQQKEQIKEIKKGTVDFISEDDLLSKLKESKSLRIKLGVDPTSSDIHLGHAVVLQKLRQFQDLGHQAVLIIGDYTALVGDPSGTQVTRPQLSPKEIKQNAKTYFQQVQKILNMKKVEIRYNGEWFSKMKFQEVIGLTSKMTVARMLEREDFSKRFKSGNAIAIHEFLYPLMQGYDSIMVKADVEIGGTDQLFNLLVGRALQKDASQSPQVVMTLPLLVGMDGVKKMSKSLNNYIGITEEPKDIFGKVMSLSDELMWQYYELLSRKSAQDLEQIKQSTLSGKLNPKQVKVDLAMEFVERFHSQKAAKEALERFNLLFQKKEIPDDIEVQKLKVAESSVFLSKLLVQVQLVDSMGDAKRMIRQGAVTVNSKKITDIHTVVATNGELVLKVGKRKFKKIIFS